MRNQFESEKPAIEPSIGVMATLREYPVSFPGDNELEEYRIL